MNIKIASENKVNKVTFQGREGCLGCLGLGERFLEEDDDDGYNTKKNPILVQERVI